MKQRMCIVFFGMVFLFPICLHKGQTTPKIFFNESAYTLPQTLNTKSWIKPPPTAMFTYSIAHYNKCLHRRNMDGRCVDVLLPTPFTDKRPTWLWPSVACCFRNDPFGTTKKIGSLIKCAPYDIRCRHL
jgi:hypothetical protein